MERKESLLQQRGPPISPIRSRDLAVIMCDRAKGSFVSGVDFEMMETNIPELIPAPQAPQKPQAPPGTFLPRFISSLRASGRSISPPAFLYAVSSAQPTITWCSGPCMWQNGISIIFSMIAMGSLEVSARQTPMTESSPFVWHSLHT